MNRHGLFAGNRCFHAEICNCAFTNLKSTTVDYTVIEKQSKEGEDKNK